MANAVPNTTKPDAKLIADLLDAFDLSGYHPGFRPAHAKGVMCGGVFTPSSAASALTRAPHASRASTPVIVRFSDSTGTPDVPDNDPDSSGPRGMAVRFVLGDHVHTDIIGHSHNGFPVRTGEEFLELLQARAVSGPDATKPTPLDDFFDAHPRAKEFATAPKPIPSSFARESFFAVTAFRFVAENGDSQYGRFRIVPMDGNDFLTEEQATSKSPNFLMDEIGERLGHGPVEFRVLVQMATSSDPVDDATAIWPESRLLVEFGTISLKERLDDSDPQLKKIIFDPIPRVDGIEASGDPLIEVRSDLYLKSGRRRRAASGL